MSKKKKISYYFDFSEVVNYFFRKKDPNRKTNFSIKAMHTVNKISIIMFMIIQQYLIMNMINY